MYQLLGDRFTNLPPLESLQVAILIDMLESLERMEHKTNDVPHRAPPRRSDPALRRKVP